MLWDKLKEYLPSHDVVYNNREINGREFDACVLLGNSGILIIEVKGWRSEFITVNGVDEIVVEGYSTPQRSPKKQARAYRFALLNKIKEKYNEYNTCLSEVKNCLGEINEFIESFLKK